MDYKLEVSCSFPSHTLILSLPLDRPPLQRLISVRTDIGSALLVYVSTIGTHGDVVVCLSRDSMPVHSTRVACI